MSRFPPIAPAQQTSEQKQAHVDLESITVFGRPLAGKDDEGALTGPFAAMLYTPSLSQPFNSLSTLITTLPHVPPRIRELAILATASAQKASYVLNAHTNIGQALGLSPTQISAACSGQVPSDLSKAEEVGLSFAIQLVRREGPLNAKVWHAAKDELGMEGVAELAHVIGAYAHVCLFQNAAGVGEQSGSQL